MSHWGHEQTNRPRKCRVCLCSLNRLQSAAKLHSTSDCGVKFITSARPIGSDNKHSRNQFVSRILGGPLAGRYRCLRHRHGLRNGRLGARRTAIAGNDPDDIGPAVRGAVERGPNFPRVLALLRQHPILGLEAMSGSFNFLLPSDPGSSPAGIALAASGVFAVEAGEQPGVRP